MSRLGYRRKVKPHKLAFAKKLRKNPTPEERILWGLLKGRTLGKWRRQHIILGWIADFYCASAKLVVELDGYYHDPKADGRRDWIIEQRLGFKTLRFKNRLVHEHLDDVVASIALAVKERTSVSPTGPMYASRPHQGECATSVLAGRGHSNASRPPASRTKPVKPPVR